MAVATPADLYWNPDYLSKLMRRKKVHDRRDLARQIDIPYTTICTYMEPDWTGSLHLPTMAAIARTFNIHPGLLIKDPRHPNPRHD